MKSTIVAIALTLCMGVCLAAEPHRVFSITDVPTIREESHVAIELTEEELPKVKPEGHIEVVVPRERLVVIFHFTQCDWLKTRLDRATRSRDEMAIRDAQDAYDRIMDEVMNDLLFLGAPREIATLDEPE